MVEVNRQYLAPCGLYCGVCAVMYATRDENPKFRERLTAVYGLPAEEIYCAGCLAPTDQVWILCKECVIKACTLEKGYEGCHQCSQWPCRYIEEFPIEVGKKVIMRTIPQWREWGTERFVEEEEKRYHCPSCGYELFRGAKRCRSCGEPVDVD
ncbi:MAG: DUF3795 domain-containing protein [Actinobacteria bacterium]|nr:DUF3795 domain-containing protein [Actinomycetota bacterium]MBU1944872.1 DUF3795 domain-containing protein [Actinomycetota bacterium]MBU2688076.1 DUF3795 domain-containing protein [Actinomycetota bacterium]